ncbi:WD repeat-containing protein 19 [Galendromus occidentalis]|uniref:WD repeat-containing protein 19 n=1 Tax=Galendromus occidentalis TaxID=34638 RepID=A0AAJ6QP46_9ACAR|nr:WD repeat-containing protein 19 [Galendromus occidentalis]
MVNSKPVFEIDGGNGPVLASWQKFKAHYLVTTGLDQIVHIYDRQGAHLDNMALAGLCSGLDWHKDGDTLAIITDRSPSIYLWDSNSQRVTQVDTGMRDTLTFVSWGQTGAFLAVGTSKGNLLIFHYRTSRKVPILGKHSKRISCGAWSKENILALSGDDYTLTVSNQEGDTLSQTSLKNEPFRLKFGSNNTSQSQNIVSCVCAKKTLYLLDIYDTDNPTLLGFQERYGNIVDYEWTPDALIILGFTEGFVVVISAIQKEIGTELYQVRSHREGLVNLTICREHSKLATASGNQVKIYSSHDLDEVEQIITTEDPVEWLQWTSDAQLLAVGTTSNISVYLTKLPVLGDSFESRFAILSSLMEVTLGDVLEPAAERTIHIDVEPLYVALGPYHVAVGINNRTTLYPITDERTRVTKEFLSSLKRLKLTADYAVGLQDNKIQIIGIDSDEGKMFNNVTCIDVTENFLIYGTTQGDIEMFYFQDFASVNQFRHSCKVLDLFAHPSGTKIVILDEEQQVFLYTPTDDHLILIKETPPSIDGVLWDQSVLHVFIIYDSKQFFLYSHTHEEVLLADKIKIPSGLKPLVMLNGIITCQTQNGKSTNFNSQPIDRTVSGIALMRNNLKNALKLRKLDDAYNICDNMNSPDDWKLLANAAMDDLDIGMASKAFKRAGDLGMAWSLETVRHVEDIYELEGYMSLFRGDFDRAQDLFIKSSNPKAALQMRRDLLHWEQALQLAKHLAPEEMPFREYAQQLELSGDYPNALSHYEKGLERGDEFCKWGIARTSVRCGDSRKGVEMALKIGDRGLLKECASILESNKQFLEAAVLFEKSKYFEKAAALYGKAKSWGKVGELLPHVTSNTVILQYAKYKESEGSYKEALEAYEKAKDFDSIIRVELRHMNNLERAAKLARDTRSVQGAKIVAEYFQSQNDMSSAIEFLVFSNCAEEAFALAQKTRQMEIYASVAENDYERVAQYFEEERDNLNAGKYLSKSGQYHKAFKYLMKAAANDNNDAIEIAVDTVCYAQDKELATKLMNFLTGETDGIPKDLRYLCRLYINLGRYTDAAKTAVVIAEEEQETGNYKLAHDILLSMSKQLNENDIAAPLELVNSLQMLHSYILAKVHVKRADHLRAAKLLMRISDNLKRFPSHGVKILTSTVIECQRAGLKGAAYKYASILLRSEYREQIEPKYKDKMEALVKGASIREPEIDDRSPCEKCGELISNYLLSCIECKSPLAMCIASGRHLTGRDESQCPHCRFRAFTEELMLILHDLGMICPMCEGELNLDQVVVPAC